MRKEERLTKRSDFGAVYQGASRLLIDIWFCIIYRDQFQV